MNNNKVKVFAVIPSGFCFGLQHVTLDYFERFTKVDSLFLVTAWNNGDFIKLLNHNGLKYTTSWLGMFSRRLDWHNLQMSLHALSKIPRLYYDFYKTLKHFKPDVLFFANHHELILLYPALKFIKVPILCHMHDPAPAIAFQKKTFSIYSSVVDQVIAISNDVKLRTIELGCPPEKILTLHNGIKIPTEVREKRENDFVEQFNWDEDVFIVGITGQMTATKGHLDLLDAFEIAYGKNNKLRLVIGGLPMEPLYGELLKYIKKWDLEKVVAFSGWKPAVSSFFKNIDTFVLASRHNEGYGLVVAEAMAHSLPVVITNSGGAIEIVVDNENGFIVPREDFKSMADKILFLSNNPLVCNKMGNSGLSNIVKNFNIDRQAKLLQDLLFRINNNALRT